MSLDLEEQYDKIYRYCYFKLHHQQSAEDITQETFLRYFQRYNCKGKEEALKCLYTIAGNLCIDEYRRRSADRALKTENRESAFMQTGNGQRDRNLSGECRENRAVMHSGDIQECVCGDMQEEQMITRLAVQKALSGLQQDEQELLLLRYVNEVPVSAVGQIFGISRFAVRRRLLAVQKKFRILLEKEGLYGA